jgi:selenocysteine lyase/cysteine desulfurase
MLKDMSRERNNLRQKQIVDETNHLLDLAKQLKDAVDKSSKDQLSLSVVNTATEIEKLAKVVKEKMRDGQ